MRVQIDIDYENISDGCIKKHVLKLIQIHNRYYKYINYPRGGISYVQT
jgi:hypothetical protein